MNYTKLDKAFSEYIRKRDANEYGMIHCITCGAYIRWQDSDCGHFVRRGKDSVRFDERNSHAQCKKCNRDLYGNIRLYRKQMILKYGLEVVEQLERDANDHAHFAQFEIDELTRHYLELI